MSGGGVSPTRSWIPVPPLLARIVGLCVAPTVTDCYVVTDYLTIESVNAMTSSWIPLANAALPRVQGKRRMCEPELQIGNSGQEMEWRRAKTLTKNGGNPNHLDRPQSF
jgi:hypothetical protein